MSIFLKRKKLIYHGAHHKMGTVWMMRILAKIADAFEWKFTKSRTGDELWDADSDIVFANHSQFDPDSLGEVVGSHMIRDPRDVIVSGYYYHLWTNESWAQKPLDRYGNMSYQDLLLSVDKQSGIAHEIRRFASSIDCQRLRNWNFADPRIIEIRYEDLWRNAHSEFKKLFRHYGFSDSAITTCLQITEDQSFRRASKSKNHRDTTKRHLRSGQPGQWKTELTLGHCNLIKEAFGDLLIKLGYANDKQWRSNLS